MNPGTIEGKLLIAPSPPYRKRYACPMSHFLGSGGTWAAALGGRRTSRQLEPKDDQDTRTRQRHPDTAAMMLVATAAAAPHPQPPLSSSQPPPPRPTTRSLPATVYGSIIPPPQTAHPQQQQQQPHHSYKHLQYNDSDGRHSFHHQARPSPSLATAHDAGYYVQASVQPTSWDYASSFPPTSGVPRHWSSSTGGLGSSSFPASHVPPWFPPPSSTSATMGGALPYRGPQQRHGNDDLDGDHEESATATTTAAAAAAASLCALSSSSALDHRRPQQQHPAHLSTSCPFPSSVFNFDGGDPTCQAEAPPRRVSSSPAFTSPPASSSASTTIHATYDIRQPSMNKRQPYACGRCGKPKKGHVCRVKRLVVRKAVFVQDASTQTHDEHDDDDDDQYEDKEQRAIPHTRQGWYGDDDNDDDESAQHLKQGGLKR